MVIKRIPTHSLGPLQEERTPPALRMGMADWIESADGGPHRQESGYLELLGSSSEASLIERDPLGFLNRLCEIYDLDHAVYATVLADDRVIGYTNYPEEWVRYYTENKLHHIDPVISAASSSIIPVNWRKIGCDYSKNEVFRLAREFGIGNLGLSVPVRGPYGDFAVFSVTKNCSEAEWALRCKLIMKDMQSIAFFYHDAIMRQSGMFKLLNKKTLSRREREVLQWYARGKTQDDIATLTGLKSSTVSAYLQSARTKLNALTSAHAAARAIRFGEIIPD